MSNSCRLLAMGRVREMATGIDVKELCSDVLCLVTVGLCDIKINE